MTSSTDSKESDQGTFTLISASALTEGHSEVLPRGGTIAAQLSAKRHARHFIPDNSKVSALFESAKQIQQHDIRYECGPDVFVSSVIELDSVCIGKLEPLKTGKQFEVTSCTTDMLPLVSMPGKDWTTRNVIAHRSGTVISESTRFAYHVLLHCRRPQAAPVPVIDVSCDTVPDASSSSSSSSSSVAAPTRVRRAAVAAPVPARKRRRKLP